MAQTFLPPSRILAYITARPVNEATKFLKRNSAECALYWPLRIEQAVQETKKQVMFNRSAPPIACRRSRVVRLKTCLCSATARTHRFTIN